MIKNIVFDMGKVLLDYDAELVCSHFISNEEERKEVCRCVFVSPEWVLLDMGVISEEEGLKCMQERLKTEHEKELAALCFAHWHEYNMHPITGMEELVRSLKAEGYGIYLCSNASVRLLSCYKELIPAIDCFDGILFSAEVKCLKPQKEMYQHLFDRFSLKPEECFFIDDSKINIQGAKDCGMDGFWFAEGNVGKLKNTLREKGIRFLQ